MADYRDICPNCGFIGKHHIECPSGGLAAEERYRLYKLALDSLDEYWMNRRLSGYPPTKGGLRRMLNRIFDFGGDEERRM